MKQNYVMIGFLFFLLTACGSNVDMVRGSYLEQFKQTKIGYAFESYFSDCYWHEFETDNKSTIVQFNGSKKLEGGIFDALKNDLKSGKIPVLKYYIQFSINEDNSFDISYFGIAFPKEFYEKENSGYDEEVFKLMGAEKQEDGSFLIPITESYKIYKELNAIYNNLPPLQYLLN